MLISSGASSKVPFSLAWMKLSATFRSNVTRPGWLRKLRREGSVDRKSDAYEKCRECMPWQRGYHHCVEEKNRSDFDIAYCITEELEEEVQRAFYHHHSQSFNILWNFTFRECMSSEGCQWNDPHWGRTTTLLRVITWNGAHYLWMANERFAQELHGVEHWNNNLSNPYSCIGDMDQRRKNTSLLWYK